MRKEKEILNKGSVGLMSWRKPKEISEKRNDSLKVHKIENFFGSDFEFCTISLLVLLKY
jgi:hypothetical protein